MRGLLLAGALLVAGCGGAVAEPSPQGGVGPLRLVEALQEGGLVVYLRHGATDRSRDDAGLIELDDCSTQRNLSDAGRGQAREIGRAFRELEVPVGDVLVSEYCRTRETAELAFGRAELEPDLTGFPNDGDAGYDARVARTRELLASPPGRGNTILVAHVKNVEAAAAISIEEGELAVFEPLGESSFEYLGRVPASAWPQLVEELKP